MRRAVRQTYGEIVLTPDAPKCAESPRLWAAQVHLGPYGPCGRLHRMTLLEPKPFRSQQAINKDLNWRFL